MNKLPWFTHDHNAHEDEFIQKSIDRFGHFGYAAYFIILELIHKYGTGGILKISTARLCLKLRSRRTQVRLYLTFSRTSDKVDFTWNRDEVRLQNKKFIERQSKMKSNTPRKNGQYSTNFPIEGEGDKDPPIVPPRGDEYDSLGFEKFWTAYPRKVAKTAASKAWVKLEPPPQLQQAILAAVGRQSETEAWKNGAGKFIPHAATWLNGRRWEDEGAAPAHKPNSLYD